MDAYVSRAFAAAAPAAAHAAELNGYVAAAVAEPVDAQVAADRLEELFLYRVPESTDDGACAASEVIAAEPFDLGRELFGREDWRSVAPGHATTATVLRLRRVVTQLQQLTGVDWLGVYKLVEKDGKRYLVKLAYFGRLSRAIFPLNELFHDLSNNSWVGMEGKARLIQDVKTYTGPYYACDQAVQSELCAPILDAAGKVLGIIDAESFQAGFFDERKMLEILKVCADLGLHNICFTE